MAANLLSCVFCQRHNLSFCEHARGHHVALESFARNVFFFLGDPMVWVAMSG